MSELIGPVMLKCTITDSDNDMSPVWSEATIRTDADL